MSKNPANTDVSDAAKAAPAPSILSVARTPSPSEEAVGITVVTIDGDERAGRLLSISDDLMHARVAVRPAPAPGEAVVFYLDTGMRFVATCASGSGGIADLRLKLSPRRASLHQEGQLGIRPLREDRVRQSMDEACTLHDSDGGTHDCRVLDISLTGLFVATDAKLFEGEVVRVGRAAAEIVRTAPGGYGMRLVDVATRPVPNPAAKRRAEKFGVGLAPTANAA